MDESPVLIEMKKETFFKELGLKQREARFLEESTGEFIKALNDIDMPVTFADETKLDDASASSPLSIPGTKFFISVTGMSKETMLSSLALIAKGFSLDRQNLIELSITVSAVLIASLIKNLVVLTNEQRSILHTILDLMRDKKAVGYSPTTDQIAKKLKLQRKEVKKVLDTMADKVVKFDPSTKGWKLIF